MLTNDSKLQLSQVYSFNHRLQDTGTTILCNYLKRGLKNISTNLDKKNVNPITPLPKGGG